jgi:hypothetical protein
MPTLADQLERMRTTSYESTESRLTEQLEQMRIRMNEVAKRESELAAELDAAVRRMDDQLLHDVRSMAAEHEARRANILNELELFAAQLNNLPHRSRQRPEVVAGARGMLPNMTTDQACPPATQDDKQRKIEDALNRYLTQQGVTH